MKLIKYLPIYLLVIVCALLSIACSNGKSPVTPSSDDTSGISSDIPISFGSATDSRSLLAVYDAVIDPAAKTFTITPVDRSAQFHFPLTQMYPGVLKITGYGWTPNFWADIKLVHPFPGSGIKGYDPRVIAILPANPGVRFIYPVMGVGGNNAAVLEPDGYTKLFDSLGGSIPGNVNPFKAYFKEQPYRVWSGTGVAEETQRWQMNIAGFGGPLQFKLVVDVSTNYPNPPQEIIDNAQEPVEIDAIVGEGLTNQGGNAPIEVRLKHWKDISEIGGVLVESPDLFDNTLSIQYYSYSPYYGASVFKGMLSNEKHALAGDHKYLVSGWDRNTNIYMFEEFAASVSYLSNDGNLIWAKHAAQPLFETTTVSYGISCLNDNSTVVTGYFSKTATFGLGDPNSAVLTSAGERDILIARYNPDGTLEWAKGAGGEYTDEGLGITTLSDNSTVVTGRFRESATFGSGETNQTVLTSAGSDDIFIARYNPDGTLVWAKRAGGSIGHDYGFGITSLSDDSTVVTGIFVGSATFGLGEPAQTVLTSAGDYDIFISRYNPNGTLAWAKHAGGSDNDYGRGITALSDNSTVVTGYFGDYFIGGSAIFGPGEYNQTVLTSTGSIDIFIARYNPDGTLAWAKHAGGGYVDEGIGITTLSDNSSVMTGYFERSATFGPGDPNQITLSSTGENDIFIARYNSNGTLAWAKSTLASSTIVSNEIVGYGITTLSYDSVAATGYFLGSTIFGPGEPNEIELNSTGGSDIFIARYNSNGTIAWAKRAGGSYLEKSCGITTLSDDSTAITGYFYGTAIFGKGEPNETYLISAGGYAMFLARFAP
jgi:uncharacterized delta-60 repeat protein